MLSISKRQSPTTTPFVEVVKQQAKVSILIFIFFTRISAISMLFNGLYDSKLGFVRFILNAKLSETNE